MRHGMLFWPWIVPIILITLILFSIYMIFKNNTEDNQQTINRKNIQPSKALKILDERYAKGEIDDNEYQKIKNNLNEE